METKRRCASNVLCVSLAPLLRIVEGHGHPASSDGMLVSPPSLGVAAHRTPPAAQRPAGNGNGTRPPATATGHGDRPRPRAKAEAPMMARRNGPRHGHGRKAEMP